MPHVCVQMAGPLISEGAKSGEKPLNASFQWNSTVAQTAYTFKGEIKPPSGEQVQPSAL